MTTVWLVTGGLIALNVVLAIVNYGVEDSIFPRYGIIGHFFSPLQIHLSEQSLAIFWSIIGALMGGIGLTLLLGETLIELSFTLIDMTLIGAAVYMGGKLWRFLIKWGLIISGVWWIFYAILVGFRS